MKNHILLLISTIFLLLQTSQQQLLPGMTASLDNSLIEQSKDVFTHYVLHALNASVVDSLKWEDGQFKDNEFNILDSPKLKAQLVPDSANNGFICQIAGINAQFYSNHFKFKHSVYIAKGTYSMEIRNIIANVFFSLRTQPANGTDRLAPSIHVTNIDLEVPKDHYKIGIRQNVVAKNIDILKKVIFENFWDEMIKSLEKQTRDTLNNKFSKVSDKLGILHQIDKYTVLDWSMIRDPQVQSSYVEFGFKGLVSKKESEQTIPRLQPPKNLPYHVNSIKSKFQVIVSNFVFESYLQTLMSHNRTQLKQIICPYQLKAFSGYQDTTSLEPVFPSIEDRFGKNVAVFLEVELLNLQAFTIDKIGRDIRVEADVGVKFVAQNKTSNSTFLDMTLTSNVLSFAPKMDEQEVYMVFHNISYGQETIISTKLKEPVNSTLFTQLMQTLLPPALDELNEISAGQILKILPTLMELYKIPGFNITNFDDYVVFSFKPTFQKPEEDIASVGYQTWTPTEKIVNYKDELYEEYLDSKGNYNSNTIRSYNVYEIFSNQMNIFKSIPYILVK